MILTCKRNANHHWPAALLAAITLWQSPFAQAWDPVKGTPDLVINMAGSSLIDSALFSVLRDNLCSSTDTDWINAHPNDGPVDKDKISQPNWGVACTLNAGAVPDLSLSTPKLLFLKYSGESSYGVFPLIQSSKGAIANTRALQRTVNITDTSKCGTDSTGYWKWKCAANIAATMDAGVSQVEPGAYRGDNKPDDKTLSDVNLQQLALLSTNAFEAGIVGIAANTLLRDALQQAQFGKTHKCVGQESEECMPSLTSGQISSLLSGQIKSWDNFQIGTRNGGPGGFLTDDAITSAQVKTGRAATPAGFKPVVHICSRAKGTAVRAGANATFLSSPCSSSGLKWAVGNPLTGPLVATGSATQWAQCMTDLTNGSGTTFDASGAAAGSNARTGWAIGIQGTEKNANGRLPYRFIKVDGIAPTQQNTWNGSYRYWYEFAMMWRNDLAKESAQTLAAGTTSSGNRKAGSANTGANKIAVLTALTASAGNATNISHFNENYAHHGFGYAGYMALAGIKGVPAPDARDYRVTNPVLAYSHANSTGQVDICRPATMKADFISYTPGN